jgi:acetoin utilization protein AcuB
MQNFNIRHLPVMEDKQFVGWLSNRDLYQVVLAAMVEEITVGDVMNIKPYTLSPETDVEAAANLMREHKIGGMPVLKDQRLVGVLTVIDLLSAFQYMLNVIGRSSRIDLEADDAPQTVDRLSALIQQAGGKIMNMAMGPRLAGRRTYSFRLERCDLSPILASLEASGVTVLDHVS